MMSNAEIDYRLAAEQLRSGKPLFGKGGALAPMLERILNAALEGGCVKIGTSSYLFFYRHGVERFFLCRFFDVKSVTSTHEAAFCVI